MRKPYFVLVAAALIGCGGSSGNGTTAPDMTPAMNPTIVGQHGQVVDYFSLMPLAGFTVADGENTTTTDAQGNWVLPAPMDVDLAPTVTGPSYSTLQLAKARAAASDVNLGPITIPSNDTFNTELNILGADTTKALVQVIIVPTGACTSVAGGTLTISKPADAAIAYFSPQALPLATQIYDTKDHRPSAVVYNIDPNAESVELR